MSKFPNPFVIPYSPEKDKTSGLVGNDCLCCSHVPSSSYVGYWDYCSHLMQVGLPGRTEQTNGRTACHRRIRYLLIGNQVEILTYDANVPTV